MFHFEEHFNQDLVTLDPIMLLKYWQSTLFEKKHHRGWHLSCPVLAKTLGPKMLQLCYTWRNISPPVS